MADAVVVAGKEEFLREFGRDYGYPNGPRGIDDVRASEFKRLNGLVYLDNGGAALYSESQMKAVFDDLCSNTYGNPHSQNDVSLGSFRLMQAARQQVLDYVNAHGRDYRCIFTSGATAALKLVGEAFPWCNDSCFMYTYENHNSVLGIREYALNKGAAAVAVDVDQVDGHYIPSEWTFTKLNCASQRQNNNTRERHPGDVYNLFAFPSECNFSGRRFDLELVKVIKEDNFLNGSACYSGSWKVLIDAAKGCATKAPDLTKFPADFLVMSFYKIFGYPTGLGALVVRAESANLLEKTYFSGGTVAASVADLDYVRRRKNIQELFEDGTQSFLGIASICHGFKLINTLTTSGITRHTSTLSVYVRRTLASMKHHNGSNVSVLYGLAHSKGQGPTIAFNLKRPDGSWIGYHEVDKLASLSGIQLRTGCFCNPGACAKYLGLSHSDLFSNIEAGHICWDNHDVLHGKPTGAVRISFGYMSTFEDAKIFINFIEKFFVSTNASTYEVDPKADVLLSNSVAGIQSIRQRRELYLKSLNIFPIKSCGGFHAASWPLCETGLCHDREWLLQSPAGEVLTQKRVPQMSFLRPFIDLVRGLLVVESPLCQQKLKIEIAMRCNYFGEDEMNLYGHRYVFQVYDNDVNQWFSEAIGQPCRLLRRCSSEALPSNNKGSLGMCRDANSNLNFVNEAQFLLITEESVFDLSKRLASKIDHEKHGFSMPPLPLDPMRFRPNLIIGGAEPYEEDSWRSLSIGKQRFSVIGGCNRCQMININPCSSSTHAAKEPLATLASYRRFKGKILFGILLRHEGIPSALQDTCAGKIDEMPILEVGARVFAQAG